MTDTETKWATRVAEWRASGQTAKAFCEGKEFAEGGLRYWSSRLNRREPEKSPAPLVQVDDSARRGGVRGSRADRSSMELRSAGRSGGREDRARSPERRALCS